MRQGITQERMAEMIDISPEVYGRLERGGIFPRVERLADICEKLGESADQLLGLSTSERPHPPPPDPQQDEWLMLMSRFVPVIPKLTHFQKLAVRRHMADLHRMLLTFVEPEAKLAAKYRKRRRTPAS